MGAVMNCVLLIIVFGVPSIILFIKTWKMTNNVKKLKNEIIDNSRLRDAKLAYLIGNVDVAKKILDDYLEMTTKEGEKEPNSSKIYDRKLKIRDTYKYLGFSVPEWK